MSTIMTLSAHIIFTTTPYSSCWAERSEVETSRCGAPHYLQWRDMNIIKTCGWRLDPSATLGMTRWSGAALQVVWEI